MNNIEIEIKKYSDSQSITFTKCIKFSFEKERYTPYSLFKGSFVTNQNITHISEILVKVNGYTIHKGLCDNCAITDNGDDKFITISSKSYSINLIHNDFFPAIYYQVNLDTIFKKQPTIPHITYESSEAKARYIEIDTRTPMWDILTIFSQKTADNFPYIAYTNEFRFTPKNPTKVLAFNDSIKMLRKTQGNNLSSLISNIHMKDGDGDYTYNAEYQYAVDNSIVRHKYLPYSKQWLGQYNKGLEYELYYLARAKKYMSISYYGFNGEDLCEKFTLPSNTIQHEISSIKIIGNGKSMITTLTAYYDDYCNRNISID